MFTPSKITCSCRRSSTRTALQKVRRGFTLIEMMVVMVLLGLLASIALPNFERWFNSTQQRVDASIIALQVQNLLARTAILNQSLELTSTTLRQTLIDGKPALDLPPGWTLRTQDQLSVNGSGYCLPSNITFMSLQQQVSIEIKDQQCNVSFRLKNN
jgi:prepilin-type N-terminal cleavage/methylation domain-containing protein